MTDEEYELLIATAKIKHAEEQDVLRKERINTYHKAWYLKNIERLREYGRTYGKKYRELHKNDPVNFYTCPRCNKTMTAQNRKKHDTYTACAKSINITE
jgi:hypothetical protein